MARPANQQSGGAGTTNPKAKVKAPAKKPAAKKPPAAYTPAPVDPLQTAANTQAAGIYAPQVAANKSLQASVPTWYANYMASAAAQAAGQQAATAPVLAQQNAAVTNLNAPAAGLDPNSAEYAKSQQAGRGLSALAQFSADNTTANLAAGQQYFAGQQANAARYLPEAQTALAQQGGVIASQQAGKAQELYQGAKTQAVNQDIAYKTLLGNQANMQTDNTLAAQTAAQAAADRKASRVVSRKNTTDRLAVTTANQQTAADKAAAKQAAADAAAKAKKTAAIQTAVGKVKNKLTDATSWAYGEVGKQYEDNKLPIDPATGKHKTRALTEADVRQIITNKYGMLGRIALAVHQGRPLDQTAQDYLHGIDPNFRVPRSWITGKASSKPTPPAGTNTTGTGKTYHS